MGPNSTAASGDDRVNKYVEKDYERIPVLKIEEGVEREQVARLKI